MKNSVTKKQYGSPECTSWLKIRHEKIAGAIEKIQSMQSLLLTKQNKQLYEENNYAD